MEIEVWYVDGTKTKVPIADIGALSTLGVLFIFIYTNAGRFRYYGGDHYAIGLRGQEWFVYAWDEYNEFEYVRGQNSREPRRMVVEWIHPPGWTIHRFTGSSVSVPDWNRELIASEAL